MKILYVAPYIPSPIRTRPYFFIRGLKEKGHSISFLGLADPYATEETIKKLSECCASVEIFSKSKFYSYFDCLFSYFKRIPLQVAYAFSTSLKKKIEQITSTHKFNIIHAEHIRAGYYLPRTRLIPAVFDSVDCMTSLYQQFKSETPSYTGRVISSIESKKLKTSEPFVISQYDGTIVTTRREKKALEQLSLSQNFPKPEISVVENGVDCDYFKPQISPFEPYAIVFSGKIGYHANELAVLHFAHNIFPRIKRKVPKAKFYIVGAGPSKKVRNLTNGNDIVVTGFVPDVRKYLQSAHVVVCPLRVAVGIQNKILEAMAMAKAVVAYPEATRSLRFGGDKPLMVADNSGQFAENIVTLMNHDALRIKMQKNARKYVCKQWLWNDKINRLEVLYARTIARYHDAAKKHQL